MTDHPDAPDKSTRDEASRLAGAVQSAAADPSASTVLRASAGSGKTKVLVDRLLRLLLNGAPMKSVVAVTFTRKAAVEIRERLGKKVRELTLMPAAELEAALNTLLGREPTPQELRRAAALPEELLEDPGGLLIGTIHTFAQALLRRFADEAGLDPDAQILEREDDLWDEALDALEREAARDPALREAWTSLANQPDQARKELRRWCAERTSLDRWREQTAPEAAIWQDAVPVLAADLTARAVAGTPLADDPTPSGLARTAAALLRTYAGPGLDAVEAADAGRSAKTKFPEAVQQRRAVALDVASRLDAGDLSALDDLLKTVLLAKGDGVKSLGGAKIAKDDIVAAAAAVTAPVLGIFPARDLLELLDLNLRLLTLGARLLDRYAALKRRDRVLDFHDLEIQARRLVQHEDMGPWVLYRMDERLDHLLVDEFQDTNRDQWELLRPFAEEFTAGLDAEGRPRTVFFVGDVKQSIYGFRGARPGIFLGTEVWLRARTGQEAATLPTNFRSLHAVVRRVGEVFAAGEPSALLPRGESAAQLSYREGDGAVVLHPVDASDRSVGEAHDRCAARFVELVHGLGTCPDTRWSDVLVLARGRTNLEPYERALREAGIPFTPAGRGALVATREVSDVTTLLRWLTFPADDTALAAILRSPLLRRSEAEVQRLLAANTGVLWHTLRSHNQKDGWQDTVAMLKAWLRRVGLDSTHELLRHIYLDTEFLERARVALGEQARYNLLRLLDLALAHDQTAFPSLRGFVQSLERAAEIQEHEEGTLPDTDRGRVRMMTIHGAKGLEAKSVILLDAEKSFRDQVERAVLGVDGPVMSRLVKKHRELPEGCPSTPVSTAAALAREEERSQEANLLYVAMTRARDEFHVLAARGPKTTPPHVRAWLTPVLPEASDTAGQAAPLAPETPDTPPYDQYELGPATGSRPRFKETRASDDAPPPLPDPGDDRLAGLGADPVAARTEAMDRGTAIHLWLQRACELGAMPPGTGAARAEAVAVFENPAHAAIFRPGPSVLALDEAPLIQRLDDGKGTRRLGVVDRLLVASDGVTVVDYKSNRTTPAEITHLVAHYRPQMEAYREAVAALYPDRPLRLVLLFTHIAGGQAETLP